MKIERAVSDETNGSSMDENLAGEEKNEMRLQPRGNGSG